MVLFRGQNALFLALTLTIIISIPVAYTVYGDQQTITNAQEIQLFVGDSVTIKSDVNSIQRVFLQGNLTAVNHTQPVQYPTDEFTFTSTSPGELIARLFFNYTTGYQVNVQTSNQSSAYFVPSHLQPVGNPSVQVSNDFTNSTTYYLSGGPSELEVDATFSARPQSAPGNSSSQSPSVGILNWTGNFGDAFPLWVKLLYFALGIQFFAVGGLWIKRETGKRQSDLRKFDFADKIYLWIDIGFKFLLVSFLALGLIMGGEFLILFVLQYMFLVSINPPSLWNLFSLGFALGAVIIVYLIRFVFGRGLDMKPLDDE